MGIWSSIKKGYQKVDEKLGGYLPGGSTPQEVAASKQPTQNNYNSQTYKAQPGQFEGQSNKLEGKATPTSRPITPEDVAQLKEDEKAGKTSTTKTTKPRTAKEFEEAGWTSHGGGSYSKSQDPIGYTHLQPDGTWKTDSQLQEEARIADEKANAEAKARHEAGLKTDNMLATLNAAFNPFSKDKVVANTEIPIVNEIAELIANHPYITAGAVQGVVALAKAIGGAGAATSTIPAGATKLAYGTEALYAGSQVTKAVASTAGKTLLKSSLVKKGFTAAAATVAVASAYVFGHFQIAEAVDKIGYAKGQATYGGDVETVAYLNQLQEELINPEGWRAWIRAVPILGAFAQTSENINAAAATAKVWDKIVQDKITQQETGEDESAYWDRVNAEKLTAEKALIDYSSEQFRLNTLWKIEAENADRDDDARYYQEQLDISRKKAKEDMEAMAKFWLDYRKKIQQLNDSLRPSNLNFGLL